MTKKASSSAFVSASVLALMRRKLPTISNLRVCARCFLRLRLPLARPSIASKPPTRSTASEIFGLGRCGSASSGFAAPPISAARRSSESRSISGRARRMACVTIAMSAAVAEAANDAVIGRKIAVGVVPAHEARDAERSAADDLQRQRKYGLPVLGQRRHQMIGAQRLDPPADPDRALRRRAQPARGERRIEGEGIVAGTDLDRHSPARPAVGPAFGNLSLAPAMTPSRQP